MIYSPLAAAASAAKHSAADAFRASLPDFERELREFRCGLEPERVRELSGADPVWSCGEVSVSMDIVSFRDMDPEAYDALFDTRTDVSLEPETVSALIAGGRAAIENNEALRAFRR
jgi:hypothetical protein